ncbi:glycosyltransferase family 2 protein [Chitinispirillales bacterium ANBcel5]|uniref:glycosyltransferase family 2 protein n=1 Tax=Cellulosispirillum alkaliphilum TaxID=3039283 RepID=UPI002A5571E9|nr:glycosyltransferase family 2 protein [Chitinispirillales bacterium ANBcel5]
MQQPLISVIIPVYNARGFLHECLNSVTHQSYRNLEIITVNDGSGDDSLNILKEYQARDSRIKIIDQSNEGVSSARNSGIKIAKGDYIFFLDADDFLSLETFKEMVSYADEGKCVTVRCAIYKFRMERETIAGCNSLNAMNSTSSISYQDYIKGLLTGKYSGFMWGLLFPAKMIKSIRLKNDLSHGEDLIFLLSCMSQTDGCVVSIRGKSLYYYRAHENAATSKTTPNSIKSSIKVVEYAKSVLSKKYYLELNISYCILLWTMVRNILRDKQYTRSDAITLITTIRSISSDYKYTLPLKALYSFPKEAVQYVVSKVLLYSVYNLKGFGLDMFRRYYGVKL